MNVHSNPSLRRWSAKRIILLSIILVLSVTSWIIYARFNRMLSNALLKSFSSTLISNVYELKFEDLQVNFFEGSIRVGNVSLAPREVPLKNYAYINSSFRLKTNMLLLENVEIFTLLKENRLILDNIIVDQPQVELLLDGNRHILVPFNDSVKAKRPENQDKKNPINSFKLNEFKLVDATIHVVNKQLQREFNIEGFSISLNDLWLSQQPGEYETSFSDVSISIQNCQGQLAKEAVKSFSFSDFKIGLDSLSCQFTLDTLMYRFHDYRTSMSNLEVTTSDSLFHVSMKSFDLSYLDKSIQLKSVSFNPNVGHDELQKRRHYRHSNFSGDVGSIGIKGISFDSLIHYQKVIVNEIVIDSVAAFVYKDNTKPLDKNKMPVYLGQTVANIPVPLQIDHLLATNIKLENIEKKPDGSLAKVQLAIKNANVKNITNRSDKQGLEMDGEGFIFNKIHFKAGLTFSYKLPQFTFNGTVDKFSLPDMNPLIQSYTPAKITSGVVDEITFAGLAMHDGASGKLKFLYHDLKIDMAIKEKAKWKSSVVAFTANSVLNSSNPVAPNYPPREVQFDVERDMNKGFMNVIIKSIIDGLKETMIMSKENRQQYQEAKKKMKEESQ